MVKIIDHLVFSQRWLKVTEFYSERRGNIEETDSIRQYNVATFSTSFYTIGIKNLQIAGYNSPLAHFWANQKP